MTDHLALVAAPILAHAVQDAIKAGLGDYAVRQALDVAEELQRAAEERVAKL